MQFLESEFGAVLLVQTCPCDKTVVVAAEFILCSLVGEERESGRCKHAVAIEMLTSWEHNKDNFKQLFCIAVLAKVIVPEPCNEGFMYRVIIIGTVKKC